MTKRIIVTGASGMLGRHLVPRLKEQDYNIYPVHSSREDLKDKQKCERALRLARPHIIFHLAANVGGLQHNLSSPASIYYDNMIMNTQLIQAAAEENVEKFIFAGSVCSYPADVEIPTSETALGTGPLETSNRAYGLSKLAALTQLSTCYEQYGMDFSYPVLANMYGPYDRGFRDDDRAHVVSSLIKKFMNDNEVVVWGSGLQTRDLLYVEDAADALVKMIDVECRDPVNIATGKEVSIEQVCDILEDITDFNGIIMFDESKPSGQLRRCYKVEKAKSILGWQASTSIEEGLEKTSRWYAGNHIEN